MACIILKILFTIFLCFYLINTVTRDAIASFFTDEEAFDEECYPILENQCDCNDEHTLCEDSPITSVCNLTQILYYVISKVWGFFTYIGCITWKMMSLNPCLSFLLGIAFTFLVLVKAPKSFSVMASEVLARFKTGDLDERAVESDSLAEDMSIGEESADETSDRSDEKVDSQTHQFQSSTEEEETKKLEISSEVIEKQLNSTETREEHENQTKGKKNTEELMKDIVYIRELEEKMEKRINDLHDEFITLKMEIEAIKESSEEQSRRFDMYLENALNQIKDQGNEFLKQNDDYTERIEKLESNIDAKLVNSENLRSPLNGFPTEEDVVRWLHSSLCPSVSTDDLNLSKTPRERRCFYIISQSPLAHEVSRKFSDMIITLENNSEFH